LKPSNNPHNPVFVRSSIILFPRAPRVPRVPKVPKVQKMNELRRILRGKTREKTRRRNNIFMIIGIHILSTDHHAKEVSSPSTRSIMSTREILSSTAVAKMLKTEHFCHLGNPVMSDLHGQAKVLPTYSYPNYRFLDYRATEREAANRVHNHQRGLHSSRFGSR
jgi:hypothetical protein